MKHAIKSVILGISLILANGSVAYAQDSQKAKKAYENGDYAIALKEWRLLAEQGNADAQYNLGEMYRNGEGVTQDYNEALKWFLLATERGNANAKYSKVAAGDILCTNGVIHVIGDVLLP